MKTETKLLILILTSLTLGTLLFHSYVARFLTVMLLCYMISTRAGWFTCKTCRARGDSAKERLS